MRLKVFQALNMASAMALVRDELGPDALILSSEHDGEAVHVTAAFEPAQAPAAPATEEHAASKLTREALCWHGLPASLTTELLRGAPCHVLRSALAFGTLPYGEADPLMLVGPPGAGKTTAVARLATRLKLSGIDALVITADGRRAGAAEQLAAFTRLLDLNLIVADSPAHLPKALARRSAKTPVLIDMPGLNAMNAGERDLFLDFQGAAKAASTLVLPTGLDPADAEELALAFKSLGTSTLMLSRLDHSRRLGGALAAAATGLRLTEGGTAPGIVDSLTALTPEFLVERLAQAPQPATPPASRPDEPEPALSLFARSQRGASRRTP